MASIFLGRSSHPFKFAMIVGGYPITDPRWSPIISRDTRVLHIWGLKDEIVTPNRSEHNYDTYFLSTKESFVHSKKHIIPSDRRAEDIYKKFLDSVI